jgi:hypothetical protein
MNYSKGREGIEPVNDNVLVTQLRTDSDGDIKSITSDDELLLSMGKAPELKR